MAFRARAALPNFSQPEDGRLKVWRYLDLERLLSLLAKAEIAYVRSDVLPDPFEGSLPLALHEWSKSVAPLPNLTASELRTAFRKQIFLSCWHLNEHESEAMWRLYCGAERGVAIQTTYEKLAAAVPHDGFIAKVRYEDYGSYVPDPDERMNMLWPFLIKRPSFAHRAGSSHCGASDRPIHGNRARTDLARADREDSADGGVRQVRCQRDDRKSVGQPVRGAVVRRGCEVRVGQVCSRLGESPLLV
jgi:hypothetical protein